MQPCRLGAIVLAAAVLTFGLAVAVADAQGSFPNRPIRVISPFPAGAVSDISLRILAEAAGQRLHTQVIVQNQPSGGGILAARQALSAPADGYTLALLSNATAVSAALFNHLAFDPVKDFVPVSTMSDFAYLLMTNAKSRFHSLRAFLAEAKARPGKLNVGTSDAGTTPYLAALLLKRAAGVDFTIVPFHGAPDLTVALLRNDVDVVINAYGGYRAALAAKQLRALATTTARRFSLLPDVPTTREVGVPNFEVASWNGLEAPAGTPGPAIDQLGSAFQAALADPALKSRFGDLGVETWTGRPADLSVRMKQEITRWNQVVDQAHIERQ